MGTERIFQFGLPSLYVRGLSPFPGKVAVAKSKKFDSIETNRQIICHLKCNNLQQIETIYIESIILEILNENLGKYEISKMSVNINHVNYVIKLRPLF